MKLKLDENLGARHAAVLVAAGHDVATVLDEGPCAATDPQVLRRSQEEGRCLVTPDLGFANPLVFDPAARAGIAVLRLPSRVTHESLPQLLRTLCEALATRPVLGKLWIIEVDRLREYRPLEGDASA